MEKERQFKYDAFISYRHTEPDKFVAENLHRQLESFRLPKSIAKNRDGKKTKIERVFRDKEELPLTSNLEEPIVDALNSSEWLIVICSPRLRESMWCQKEIETFVKLRGREHVLAVLAEGEPSESFPEELLYVVKEKTMPDGSVVEEKIPVEPLAADVRGKDKKEMLRAMKTEILRLLAAIFELSYDDLRQRHRERKMRRIVTASLVGGAACLAIGAYSTATAIHINHQKMQIESQSQEILAQNEELALLQAQSLSRLATQYLNSGDRASAVLTAKEALTESEGVKLPYTPEAQYILAESLRVYDTGNIYKADYQYEVSGKIDSIKKSPDSDAVVFYDNTEILTLYDLVTKETLLSLDANEYGVRGIHGCTFLGDNYFAYIHTDGYICIYDINEKKVIKELTPAVANSLIADAEGKYLGVNQWGNTYVVYDTETFEEIGETPELTTDAFLHKFFLFSDGTFAGVESLEKEDGTMECFLVFVDLNSMQEFSRVPMGARELTDLKVRDGVAYASAALYDDGFASCDAYAAAYNMENGALIWEYEQKGMWPSEVKLPLAESAKQLLYITNASVSLIDMASGNAAAVIPVDSGVVECGVYQDMSNFLLLTEDGSLCVVTEEQGEMVDLSYKFECKTVSNDAVMRTPYGIVVLAHNDNKITVYTSVAGPDVKETEGVYELPEESDVVIGDEAVEISRSYGIDNPEYVIEAYYSEDKKYCFIRYWDNKFLIYDISEKKVCNTMEDVYPTDWCMGTDADGNSYLLGYYGCYILNQDMKPIMWIPDVKAVDLEQQKVYLNWNNTYYEAPVYTADELIGMAESYQ